MKTLLSILLIASSASIYAQEGNADNFKISTNQPILFTFSDIEELLTNKTISNAIELQVKARAHTRNVSAHIDFSGSDHNFIPKDWISLRLSSKTASNAFVSSSETKLNTSPALLFSQPGSRQEEIYSFNYDVILNPLSTFIKNGSYSFSITFTMTEP